MLATIAADGYTMRSPTGDGAEETPGNALSARAFTEGAILRPADAQPDDRFGVYVAISGDIAIVGADGEDGGAGDPLSSAGAAYVFRLFPLSGWLMVKKLTAPDAQAGDFFGFSVAISGDTAIVGAPFEDGGAGDPRPNAGAAYVFGRDEGGASNWGQVAKLTALGAQANAEFGGSVAISGDTAIVGAGAEDGGAGDLLGNAGAAYVFGRDEGGANNWGEVAKLTASDAQALDEFGSSVAISGDTAIVGAFGEDGGAGDPLAQAGAAYVFRESFLRFFIGALLSEPDVGRLPTSPSVPSRKFVTFRCERDGGECGVAIPPQPFGRMGLAGDLGVGPPRRCTSASPASALLDIARKTHPRNATNFRLGTLGSRRGWWFSARSPGLWDPLRSPRWWRSVSRRAPSHHRSASRRRRALSPSRLSKTRYPSLRRSAASGGAGCWRR